MLLPLLLLLLLLGQAGRQAAVWPAAVGGIQAAGGWPARCQWGLRVGKCRQLGHSMCSARPETRRTLLPALLTCLAPLPAPWPPPCPCCSCGGVVVTSADGKIVCSNTLDDRLRITYSSNLPTVRSLLFGAAA